MTNEDYVSYETAVKLKEFRFDWPCNAYYTTEDAPDGEVWLARCCGQSRHQGWPCRWLAPSLWVAQKWLREKGYAIEPRVWLIGSTREYRPYIMPSGKCDYIALPPHDTYESALSAGIEAALKLIEEGEG